MWSLFKGLRDDMIWLSERFAGHLAPMADVGPVAVFLFGVLLTLASGLSASGGADPAAASLKPDTLAAFNKYASLTEAHNNDELQRGTNLLWVDSLQETERAPAYAALKRGEVKMRKLDTRESGDKIRCPGGMIHHWTGVVFIPGAKLPDVLQVRQDYDHHAQSYAPEVERSKIESRDGDHFLVFLRFRRHKVITVVLNTEHDVRYFRDSETQEHSRSSAPRIAELENAAKTNDPKKPPATHGRF